MKSGAQIVLAGSDLTHEDELRVLILPEQIESLVTRLSKGTRLAYRRSLLAYHAWLANTGNLETGLTKFIIDKYLGEVEKEFAARNERSISLSSMNQILAAFRWYAREMKDVLAALTDIKISPATRLRLNNELDVAAAVHRRKVGREGEAEEVGRYITLEEMTRLLQACNDGTPAGVRDRAMFSVAYQTGMRVHEIAGLPLIRVKAIPEGYEINVIGKGNRRRKIFPQVIGGGAVALRAWLELRGDVPGACFCWIDRHGNFKISNVGMTTDALQRILARRTDLAHIERKENERGENKTITWHDFRRTIITGVIESGGLEAAYKFIGHATVNQTTKYDRGDKQKVYEAVRKLKMPEGL